MKTSDAVTATASRFKYLPDKKLIFGLVDHWSVMKERDGVLIGDCDDFTMTTLWKRCDEDLISFIFNVMILHRFKMYFAMTKNGERHMVGYADGLWFDNWTKKAVDKEEFIRLTGHKIWFFFPSPLMVIPMIVGLFMRNVKR